MGLGSWVGRCLCLHLFTYTRTCTYDHTWLPGRLAGQRPRCSAISMVRDDIVYVCW